MDVPAMPLLFLVSHMLEHELVVSASAGHPWRALIGWKVG